LAHSGSLRTLSWEGENQHFATTSPFVGRAPSPQCCTLARGFTAFGGALSYHWYDQRAEIGQFGQSLILSEGAFAVRPAAYRSTFGRPVGCYHDPRGWLATSTGGL